MSFNELASKKTVEDTTNALRENGFEVHIVDQGKDAFNLLLTLIPKGSPVMNMTSVTLSKIGFSDYVSESEDYEDIKSKLHSMDETVDGRVKAAMGAAPLFAVGSAHAVTENGQVVIASNTGSQLPAYAYGAETTIFVIGTQKIVKDLDQAMKRIYEHILPLESKRAHEAYGVEGSNVSKLLIINKEVNPNRIKIILVNESLGF